MMENIILTGGGGHCRAVIDVIEMQNRYEIVGIIDKKELIGQDVLGYKIIGCDDDLETIFQTCKNAAITVGQIKSNEIRVKLFDKLKKIGFNLPVIASPLAYVSKHSSIDEGTVIMHHAVINASAKVGENCIVNTKALIEHDAVVEKNCHISTGAIVNGGAVVKKNTFYGSNATSKEYVEVSGFIKAGSVVK
ncbi:acetyltransferase [Sulfurimonas sp.]|jgi:sugar O-acyltransferase (sialic acid O-acetyltransferase NeuD family)|uniref:PglD-related sugar-binding protein n=1 Tax=Sulfurimonas sp. TaxID=2022749 RepID=UPI002A36C306|nr:acetyltransferase [Sulfurimonas sp.]MDY0123314.1 acetyltransferase [Sulfurimonas sp.]